MQKIKTLFSESKRSFVNVQCLAILGILMALAVVLGFVASIDLGPYIRIGFSGLPNRIVEYLFGPIVGCIFGGIGDIVKFIVKPSGPFFFGFTFNAMLSGIIYGAILYKKPIHIGRIFVAELIIKVLINCVLNTLWLDMLYGKGFFAILPMCVLKNAIMLPIDTIILFIVLTFVEKNIKKHIRFFSE